MEHYHICIVQTSHTRIIHKLIVWDLILSAVEIIKKNHIFKSTVINLTYLLYSIKISPPASCCLGNYIVRLTVVEFHRKNQYFTLSSSMSCKFRQSSIYTIYIFINNYTLLCKLNPTFRGCRVSILILKLATSIHTNCTCLQVFLRASAGRP